MILALDLGTRCGWAVTPERSGVWSLSPKGDQGPGSRYLKLSRHMKQFMPEVELLVYEKVMSHGKGGTRAAHVYGGYLAVAEAMCEPRGIPLMPVHVATLKKFATGSGRAMKKDMVAAAEARGWKVIDDNHADALWLLEYAKENRSA